MTRLMAKRPMTIKKRAWAFAGTIPSLGWDKRKKT